MPPPSASPTPSRADASLRRRAAILDAALQLFATEGYDRTTLADIRRRAGASTGSIYHHFASKEALAAALYLRGVEGTQQAGLAALLATDSAADGVAALVRSYLDWVVANPELARFLLQMRHERFVDAVDGTLASMNAEAAERSAAWWADRVAAGDVPDLAPEVRRALIFGPCRHWAGTWLNGRATVSPDQAAASIAAAALAGLRALA